MLILSSFKLKFIISFIIIPCTYFFKRSSWCLHALLPHRSRPLRSRSIARSTIKYGTNLLLYLWDQPETFKEMAGIRSFCYFVTNKDAHVSIIYLPLSLGNKIVNNNPSITQSQGVNNIIILFVLIILIAYFSIFLSNIQNILLVCIISRNHHYGCKRNDLIEPTTNIRGQSSVPLPNPG